MRWSLRKRWRRGRKDGRIANGISISSTRNNNNGGFTGIRIAVTTVRRAVCSTLRGPDAISSTKIEELEEKFEALGCLQRPPLSRPRPAPSSCPAPRPGCQPNRYSVPSLSLSLGHNKYSTGSGQFPRLSVSPERNDTPTTTLPQHGMVYLGTPAFHSPVGPVQ